jgi:hypothetical protein
MPQSSGSRSSRKAPEAVPRFPPILKSGPIPAASGSSVGGSSGTVHHPPVRRNTKPTQPPTHGPHLPASRWFSTTCGQHVGSGGARLCRTRPGLCRFRLLSDRVRNRRVGSFQLENWGLPELGPTRPGMSRSDAARNAESKTRKYTITLRSSSRARSAPRSVVKAV